MEQEGHRNHYADHLAAVNETNQVITTEDICSNQGATIVPQGTVLTREVSDKIARFSLLWPLELQVRLESSIPPSQLFSDILTLQKRMFRFADTPALASALRLRCGELASFPLLTQKLTVLAERMPERYGKTQSVSSFALMLAIEAGMNDESIAEVFMAAQMHESGYLNLPPEVGVKWQEFAPGQRRELDKEQLTENKRFLDQVVGLSRRVGVAVLEQKERPDGTGWPFGLIGTRLGVESQILGMANILHEAYAKYIKPRGYDIRHLLPMIQVEADGFDPLVYGAAVSLLKEHAHGNIRVLPSEFISPLAKYLIVLQRFLEHWLALARQCAIAMRETKSNPKTERAIKVVSCLEDLFRNSGLWDITMRDWLHYIAEQGSFSERAEVEVISLMYEAVMDRFQGLNWALSDAANDLNPEWASRCDDISSLLGNLPENHMEVFERYDGVSE